MRPIGLIRHLIGLKDGRIERTRYIKRFKTRTTLGLRTWWKGRI